MLVEYVLLATLAWTLGIRRCTAILEAALVVLAIGLAVMYPALVLDRVNQVFAGVVDAVVIISNAVIDDLNSYGTQAFGDAWPTVVVY